MSIGRQVPSADPGADGFERSFNVHCRHPQTVYSRRIEKKRITP